VARSHSLYLAIVSIVSGLISQPFATTRAEDGPRERRVYTQAPEIAASQVAGQGADEPGQPVDPAARDLFHVPAGFQVERLFTVPKEELGSWVCLITDPQGRLIASDQQDRGLYRITPAPIGSQEPTRVERLDLDISAAQGMLFAFDSLYLSVNGGPGSGLYRARDTNGDDQFDEVVKLREFRGGGEHGPHALRLSPDGQSIYVICGNHTHLPADVIRDGDPQTMGGPRPAQLRAELPPGLTSRMAPNWDEDLLLPRQWDGNGHAAGVLAPGGWIARTDPNGETWELVSTGYRNAYDMAFNADGELFAYDADMEWDFGTPWYRPTRVVHATSGSEFGWRSGTGKWPTYYPDSLPPLVNIGPGSPVGVEFGQGTRFPARYQRALYICDWTFGTMYSIDIEPDGASYRGTRQEFLSRTPLPLTDATVGHDGALYFTVGGRGTQSELYRVTYIGDEATDPVELHDVAGTELRGLRRRIEALHAPAADPAAAVAFLLPHLGHADRFIRYAARVALERQPVELWREAVLAAADPETLITGAVGLARQGSADARDPLLAALDRLDFGRLDEGQQLALARAYQLALIRLGPIDDDTRMRLAAKFDALFPSASPLLDRELATLLVALQAPAAAEKLVPYLTRERSGSTEDAGALLARNPGYGDAVLNVQANPPDLQQLHYAFVLRNLKTGWTTPLRQDYFQWFAKARQWSGGASYMNFLKHIDEEAYDNCTDAERLAVEALGSRQPYQAPELPKPVGPGRAWTLDEVLALAQGGIKGRNFENGKRTYAAARCVVCHRFGGEGGATGPDLTQLAGRFNLKDLTEAMTDPSKVISDQYKASIIVTGDGVSITGRIVSEDDEEVTLVVDPENSAKVVTIAKAEIDERQASAVSLMPKDLFQQLNQDEVLDLLAYLLSRGNPDDAMFRQ
jgi:putative heme-binding domain-containing protein